MTVLMTLSGAEMRVALALLCACVAVALAHAHEKRAESESGLVSPVPFTFAARYGRSPQRLITPRNNRWMMTTRYGKRSETTEEGSTDIWSSPPLGPPTAERRDETETLSCKYTGVLTLYRCTRNARTHKQAQFARNNDDDPAPNGEE